jgi:glutaredoxin
MSNLILYELPGCPYCAKVIDTLDELGLEYESRTVPRSRGDRTEVKEVSGQAGVPVLIDEAHGIDGMPESDDIVAHLEANYAN